MKIKMTKDTLLNLSIIILGFLVVVSFYTRILPNLKLIKHQFRCNDISTQQKKVVENFTFKDDITFCSEDLVKDKVNGFYVDRDRRIYIDNTYTYFKGTLYHEYSHFLMSKKSRNLTIHKVRKSTGLTNEELTDLTSIYILLSKGDDVDHIFSYILPEQALKSSENELFKTYINDLLQAEGIKKPDIAKLNEIIKKGLSGS